MGLPAGEVFPMSRVYDLRQTARILGVTEQQVRAWRRQGLAAPINQEHGALCFDFRGLVALRTVRDLRRQGVALSKIRQCVARLHQMLPDLAQPLAEVRVQKVEDRLVLSRRRRQFTPDGQILLDFQAPEALPGPVPTESYEDLFMAALDDEDAGRLEEARRKYETILAAAPAHVDALVNLGNLWFLTGAEDLAASCYLKALRHNPDHVEGNYNLANLLEGQGNLEGAILFYQKAIHEDPEFADAHFNLAMVLELVGDAPQARRHWRAYLHLNPDSKWAPYIRRRLEDKS
jgi:tetratricopeptide (TPR) repeat protein